MDIGFEFSENASQQLAHAVAQGAALGPLLGEIGIEMLAETQERFESGTTPGGIPWLKSQRVQDEGGKTLVLSGDLLRSIKLDRGDDFAAVGPDASGGAAIYAKIHQFGGRIKPKDGKKALNTPYGPRASVTMPARPYLGWSEALIFKVHDITRDWLASALNSQRSA